MSANNPPRGRSYWKQFTPEEQRWLKRLGFGRSSARSDDDVRNMKESIRKIIETRQRYGINAPSPSGHNQRRVFFDSSIQKYTATKFLKKYGNLTGSGPTKAAAVRSLKESIERAKAGRNPSELLVMAANPRVEVVHGDNPPVEDIAEDFSGTEVKWLDVYNEPHIPRGRYAYLAKLFRLFIKPQKGGQVQKITFHADSAPLIVSDASGKQLYFVDGSQDISACLAEFVGANIRDHQDQAGLIKLGESREIDYLGKKHHIGDEDTDEWRHKHGEENGVLPTVMFSTQDKKLLYEGGDYRIEGPWIHN